MKVTDYENTNSFSRWVVHVPYSEYRGRSHVSSIRTLQYLSFVCTWEKLWRTPLCVLLGVKIADDIIHRSLSPVGYLKSQRPSWGMCQHFSYMSNDPTSPVGRDSIAYTSHLATYYPFTCILIYCVASTLWLPGNLLLVYSYSYRLCRIYPLATYLSAWSISYPYVC